MSLPETRPLSDDERRFLQEAVDYLENPRLLMSLANLVGKPTGALLAVLPQKAQVLVHSATGKALNTALSWAMRSLPAGETGGEEREPSWMDKHKHTAAAATTGAVGGFFGIAGMALELPATTTIMLRSIASIAAQQGCDLSDPAVRLQCLAVFSFGSPTLDKMESAYFTGRLGMTMAVADAASYVARHSARELTEALSKGTAPVLVRLLNQIASRFQIVVSQKLAAQAVPIAGAATGALINAAFTDHFNTVARLHFGIVRLEQIHGKEVVQAAYHKLRLEAAAQVAG